MTYRFGRSSIAKLNTVEDKLQIVMKEAILHSPIDFGIISGLRTAEEQNKIFFRGASQRDGYVKVSKHQSGLAIDFACYEEGKLTWEGRYYYAVVGVILSTADRLGYDLRSGSDWDMDGNFSDQTFDDLGHIEIIL